MLGGAVLWFHDSGPWIALIGLVIVLYTMWSWWADVIAEGEAGDHTPIVQIGLRYGMVLFIISEVMFFSAWFWTFFKHALYPMGRRSRAIKVIPGTWPPAGIETLRPLAPAADQHADPALLGLRRDLGAPRAGPRERPRPDVKYGLWLAIVLGVLFTTFQAYEYSARRSSPSPATSTARPSSWRPGFHGFHVIIGTIFLAVCLVRVYAGHFTPTQHVGFEAAAWYWHFVDVVWLFLFAAIYIWGADPLAAITGAAGLSARPSRGAPFSCAGSLVPGEARVRAPGTKGGPRRGGFRCACLLGRVRALLVAAEGVELEGRFGAVGGLELLQDIADVDLRPCSRTC